ncbi:membrane protein [Actinotalea ferrariae CF5-4]|uniref:Membrane protein n=1 Tax=Actinotalea ferrariae CF5-4 TaxID=948458 RepID=A0A021VUQ2_9CELL|nr:DMT family transporter [Actinotalea ferrariae]EYR64914.1 membrane protein [Actinotalea ferrariae CF5-4]
MTAATTVRPGVAALGPGLALALVSAAAFGSSGPFAKALLDSGWSPGAAVTARIGGAALVLLVPSLLLLRGRMHVLRRHAALMVTYGVVAMAAVQLAFFNAVTTLSVGVALLLEYLGVVLVVVWLWVRHGQRPRRWTLVGVGLAVAGLLLVLDLGGGASVDLGGVLWGLGAAVGLAAYFVLSAREATGLPPLVMACGGMVAATVALAVAGTVGVMPMTAGTDDVVLAGAVLPWWAAVLELALVAAVLAYATGIAATRRLGSKVAGFVGLTEVMFSLVFAWLLLGELPLPVQLAGGGLIVAGVLAVRYDELRGAGTVPLAASGADLPGSPRDHGASRLRSGFDHTEEVGPWGSSPGS